MVQEKAYANAAIRSISPMKKQPIAPLVNGHIYINAIIEKANGWEELGEFGNNALQEASET